MKWPSGYGREWELSLNLGDGNVFDERKWKVIINYKVKDYKFYFFSGNKGSSLVFKAARTNSLEIKDRTYRFNESRERLCKMCNMEVEETFDHLIVECPAYDIARVKTMGEYKGILRESKFREIINSEDNELGFVLGIGSQTPNSVLEVSKAFLCEICRIWVLSIQYKVRVFKGKQNGKVGKFISKGQ